MARPRLVAAIVVPIALSLSGAAQVPLTQAPGCGVFGGERVVIEFNVTGGGTWTQSGGRVITQDDEFSGKVTLSKSRPDDLCVTTADWAFKLKHKENSVDVSGRQVTVTIEEAVERPQAVLGFALNPYGDMWLFHPRGLALDDRPRPYGGLTAMLRFAQ